jgi:single-stranded-DNA-specific exonuclease
METPEDAFYMLAETDREKATARVDHLEKLNTERKGKVAAMSKELHKRIDGMVEIPPVLVLGNPEWRPSLVGLAAGKLAELHNRPAFIWGKDGNGVIKGSCRSGGNVSIVKIMEAVDPKTWLEFGGHHQAGGFSVSDEAIHTLSDVVNAAHSALGTAAVEKNVLSVESDLTLTDITMQTLQSIKKVGPYGMANPKPLFRIRAVTPASVELFGKTKEHTKLIFSHDTGSVEAIAFFMTPEQFTVIPKVDTAHDFLVHLEESFFMGRQQLRLRIVDILQ